MDILMPSDYKTALSSQTDALLADRGRIDSSHRMMDETLGYVFPTTYGHTQLPPPLLLPPLLFLPPPLSQCPPSAYPAHHFTPILL